MWTATGQVWGILIPIQSEIRPWNPVNQFSRRHEDLRINNQRVN